MRSWAARCRTAMRAMAGYVKDPLLDPIDDHLQAFSIRTRPCTPLRWHVQVQATHEGGQLSNFLLLLIGYTTSIMMLLPLPMMLHGRNQAHYLEAPSAIVEE